MHNLLFLTEEPIAGRVQTQNMGFILFLVCFFILIYQLGRNSKLLLSMAGKLFGNRNQTTHGEVFTGELPNILLFCIQTILLISVISYCHALYSGFFPVESPAGMFLFMGYNFLLLSIFVAYKYLMYAFVGYIFFDREAKQRWNSTFSSAICLSGPVLFFPALILFYAGKIYGYGIYLILAYFVFIWFVLRYRQFVLFFNKKGSLLYFILYLCTLEIIPLFLLYKGFVYLFLMQKDNLWT